MAKRKSTVPGKRSIRAAESSTPKEPKRATEAAIEAALARLNASDMLGLRLKEALDVAATAIVTERLETEADTMS